MIGVKTTELFVDANTVDIGIRCGLRKSFGDQTERNTRVIRS